MFSSVLAATVRKQTLGIGYRDHEDDHGDFNDSVGDDGDDDGDDDDDDDDVGDDDVRMSGTGCPHPADIGRPRLPRSILYRGRQFAFKLSHPLLPSYYASLYFSIFRFHIPLFYIQYFFILQFIFHFSADNLNCHILYYPPIMLLSRVFLYFSMSYFFLSLYLPFIFYDHLQSS